MKINILRNLLIFGFWITLISACDSSRVYQEFADFDQEFWHQDSVVTFQFKIEDANRPYHLKTLIRNGQQYPYHNLYYQCTLTNGSGEVLNQELIQMFLFDPKTGTPNGSGVGDIFDNSQTIKENFTFPSAGEYTVAIQQYMRLDTLPHVHSVGWRIESAKK